MIPKFMAYHKQLKKLLNVSIINFNDHTVILQDPNKLYKDVPVKGKIRRRQYYIHARFDQIELQIES